MKLDKQIMLLEEEARAQLTLAQSGKDEYAWNRYNQIIEHVRALRNKQ